MMHSNHFAVVGNLVDSKTEEEKTKMAEQCATVLCLIANGRGDDGVKVTLAIGPGNGTAKGLWQVTAARLDKQTLH